MRLFLLTEDTTYLDKAEQTRQAFTSVFEKSLQQSPSLVAALDWYLHGTVVKSDGDRLQTFTRTYPNTVAFKPFTELPAGNIALVCQGLEYLAPSTPKSSYRSRSRPVFRDNTNPILIVP